VDPIQAVSGLILSALGAGVAVVLVVLWFNRRKRRKRND